MNIVSIELNTELESSRYTVNIDFRFSISSARSNVTMHAERQNALEQMEPVTAIEQRNVQNTPTPAYCMVVHYSLFAQPVRSLHFNTTSSCMRRPTNVSNSVPSDLYRSIRTTAK
jgi:hypothetical protein